MTCARDYRYIVDQLSPLQHIYAGPDPLDALRHRLEVFYSAHEGELLALHGFRDARYCPDESGRLGDLVTVVAEGRACLVNLVAFGQRRYTVSGVALGPDRST